MSDVDLAKTLELRTAQVAALEQQLAGAQLMIADLRSDLAAAEQRTVDELAAGGAPSASAQLVGRDVWLTTVPRGAEESYNFRSAAKVLAVDAAGVLVSFITWSPWVRDRFTGEHDEDGEEIWTFQPRVRTDRGLLFYPWRQVQAIEQIDDRTPAELAEQEATS